MHLIGNVLSLFDGMSCGQIALNRANIHYSNYYASEVDPFAIKVTQKNYPNTIQLGDVSKIDLEKLPKIDLLIGGSPCQGFSFAGKQLNFNDPRSKLFFEFYKILQKLKPKYFLLENVKMKKEFMDVISNHLDVEPTLINSSLFSAQNRERLYWTNINFEKKITDKNLKLKNIIGLHDSYEKYPYVKNDKQGFSSLCFCVGMANLKTHDVRRRVYSDKGKSPTLTTATGGYHAQKVAVDDNYWRYLTPEEYEKLQTVEVGYTSGVSNSQRYKMLGNGWTVDVIAHIFKGIKQ